MAWQAPMGYIQTITTDGAPVDLDLSDLKEGILLDENVPAGSRRVYSVKKGNQEKYLCINRFSRIDPNT
jgi:hypothetical protein